MERYFIINKPAGMVSQFLSPDAVPLLGDLDFNFPPGTHAIGRLDKDSEGLLLLTTDKKITRLLFLDAMPHERTYLVMVQNEMSDESLQQLEQGIPIRVGTDEYYVAKPTAVQFITDPQNYYNFSADHRKAYPHTWLLITLTEGKFRQVRKMVLALRHRCQRLVRLSISGIRLGNMRPGEVREMSAAAFYQHLHLSPVS